MIFALNNDPNPELDDNIERSISNYCQTNNEDPPNLISNSLIYSPYVTVFDYHLKNVAWQIEKKKSKIKNLLRERKQLRKQLKMNKEETPEELQEVNDKLTEECNRLLQNSAQDQAMMNEVTLTTYDKQLAEYNANFYQLKNKFEELNTLCQQIQEELSLTKETNKMFQIRLDKSTQMITNYQKLERQLNSTASELNRNKEQLAKRGREMSELLTQLQLTKTGNEKEIRQLEEQYSDHQQLIVSYKMLEDRIKEQGKQQEIALNRMVEAVELTESAAAESQKNKLTRDNYSEELDRLKNLITQTTQQFDESFSQYEQSVKDHFESSLKRIQSRSFELESENLKKSHQKESIQKQIDSATQENSLLKTTKIDNGFSDFVEKMSALKAEIEAAFGRREQLKALKDKTKDNINEMKSRMIIIGTNARTDKNELTKRAEYLKTELENYKSICKDIMEENATLNAKNQDLRSEIVQVQQAATNEARNRLVEKDNEIAEIKIQIDATSQANSKAIGEMQEAVLGFKQHADKWKSKTQSIGIEANDMRQNAENQQKELIDQINGLEKDLSQRKQLCEQAQAMIQQMDQQIKSLKQQISASEKKQRQLNGAIQQTIAQQNQYAAEINRNKAVLDKLQVQVKREQRNNENKPNIYNNSDLSDSF